ncbi:MAG TPA: YegP family protein [Burkholderiaceae bacterium]|nr:YegP family protein [Burkholderiaceae bacterium]
MAGYYEIKRAESGFYSFTLKAGNHQVILASRMHATEIQLHAAIALVRRCSQYNDRYRRMQAKDGSPYFVLTDEYGETLGVSEMYRSLTAMENGIRSVMENGQTQVVKEYA